MTNIPAEPGYTYPEKLQLVAQGVMDPKEVGLASEEEAMGKILQVLPEAKPEPHLGKFLTFEVSEVPMELRRQWAKQDTKIIGSFDAEEWDNENKDTHRLQARLRCGNINTMLEQTFADEVEGYALMLEGAALALRNIKENLAKGMQPKELPDPRGEKVIDVEAEVVSRSES